MPKNKKNRGLLNDAWDYLSSAGANVLGAAGDIESVVRHPVDTLSGLASLINPHLKTSSLLAAADMPVQDSDTIFPTSDELTSAAGGRPYSAAGLLGGLVGAPLAVPKVARLASKLRAAKKLSALEKVVRGTGVLPHEPFYSDKLSTLAETMRKRPLSEANELAAKMGVQQIPGILREGGIAASETPPAMGAGIFEGSVNPVAPIPIGVPSGSEKGSAFLRSAEPLTEALAIASGQAAEAPGFIPRAGQGAFKFNRQLNQQEVIDMYNRLKDVNIGGKPIAKGVVDRGARGTILTSFDENEALPSRKILEQLTGEKVTPVGYSSNYVEGIKEPVTGTGQHAQRLAGLLDQNPAVNRAFSGESARRFAQEQLGALEEGKQRYGLTEGLGPQFDINTAHKNLLQIISQEKNGSRLADLIRTAVEAGVPLPALIMVLESKGGQNGGTL